MCVSGVSCLFPTAWTWPKYLGECLSLLSSCSRDIYLPTHAFLCHFIT